MRYNTDMGTLYQKKNISEITEGTVIVGIFQQNKIKGIDSLTFKRTENGKLIGIQGSQRKVMKLPENQQVLVEVF